MKIIEKEQAEIIKNSDTSELLEYSKKLNEKNIDFCINTISGRYPQKGFCTNQVCQELCYIIEGSGNISKKDQKITFKKGDIIFIDKNEIYYWNGECKIIMVCTPAWYKEQCKLYDK